MTNRERLRQAAGVWEGIYTHLTPEGQLIDQHASRQETRLEGDQWYERIIYRWPDGRQQTLDFHARLEGDQLVFDDPQFHGQLFHVTDDISIFSYYWKDRPNNRVVETIVFKGQDRKARLWQVFEGNELIKVTIIVERRVAQSSVTSHQ